MSRICIYNDGRLVRHLTVAAQSPSRAMVFNYAKQWASESGKQPTHAGFTNHRSHKTKYWNFPSGQPAAMREVCPFKQ